MIYLMYGSNKDASREKTRSLVDALKKKRPDALFYRITALTFEENPIDSLVAGQGLFESKYIVFYDSVFESKEIKEKILESLKEIESSENIFIFLEGEIDKKSLDKITKHSEKTQEFALKEAKKKAEYNPFAISDALLSKDKKRLWMLLLEAKKKAGAPEEIHGIIWWQIKSLALVEKCGSAAEAELSPFVFSKAKSALKNFSSDEIKKLSFSLVKMYHDAHRGISDLWIEMEKMALRM